MTNGLSGFSRDREVGSAVHSCPWIEIELLDEDNEPVPGEKYRVTQSDGKVLEGFLDDKGFVRLAPVVRGTRKITFPDLDKSSWKKI